MSTVFHLGSGPGPDERSTVYADNGNDSVKLGVLDEYGRLIVYDDMRCSRAALSADELLKLADFVREQNDKRKGEA